MTIDTFYEDLARLAERVAGANEDVDAVPSKRQLAVARVGGDSPGSEDAVLKKLREEYPLEDARSVLTAQLESLEADEYWTQSAVLQEIRHWLEKLDGAAASEGDAAVWSAFDAYQHCVYALRRMYRRLERESLDDGCTAARFLLRQLGDLDDGVLASLLAESDEYIADMRNETDRAEPVGAPWDEARATLIAQLVFDLRETATPAAVAEWFSYARSELDDCTALETIERLGTYEAGRLLRDLARRAHGQVAT